MECPNLLLRIFAVIFREKNDEFLEKGGGHSNPKCFVAKSVTFSETRAGGAVWGGLGGCLEFFQKLIKIWDFRSP